MTPERWRQIEAILEGALEIDDVDERALFVAASCAGDEDLRKEVVTLIASYREAASLMEKPILGTVALVSNAREEPDAMIGQRLGAYRIIKELGRGGMGAVYLAERADSSFRKRVAIKLIKRGMDTDFILRRFRNERQILAALDHQHIGRLLDGGTTADGRPYFVMEYIEGHPLTKYCDTHRLSINERLRLFQQLCAAVSHAHEQLVIHRDIKPSNIMVTEDGTPKLLDFGIAKLLNPELADGTLAPTTMSTRLMTPEYASPEQVQGSNVTPASDQYSLGVILYELVTGHRPYRLRSHAPLEMARVICEEEPTRPSIAVTRTEESTQPDSQEVSITPEIICATRSVTLPILLSELEKGLEQIILQTLRKEASERYASVAELSADIDRFLAGATVLASVSFPASKAESGRNTEEAIARQHSIAVLPFKLLSPVDSRESGVAFLGLGLADALITRLSALQSLTVRPTTAVLKYQETTEDMFTLGRELKVGFVLEGRLLRIGSRLRVSVQLISVRDESTLWAAQFEEKFTDIFSVQDSISEQVAAELTAHLSSTEREQLAKRGTTDPRAYEAYMRGRVHWHTYTEDGLAQAHKYFQQAIAFDPDFAAAHTGIADYYNWLCILSGLPPAQALQPAKEAAARAIRLDNKLAEAYASLGFTTWAYDWDLETSERLFKRAFELNNNYEQAHEWYAQVCASEGRFDEAIGEMNHARSLDPYSSSLHTMTAYILHYARRYEECVWYLDRALEIEPNNWVTLQGYGWEYPMLGRAEDAIALCRKAVEVSGHAPTPMWTFAHVYLAAGQREDAQGIIDEMHEMSQHRHVSPYFFAVLYTSLNDFDKAFEWFDRALTQREYWMRWITVEARLDPLRSDPRYDDLLRRREQATRRSEFANLV